MENKLTVFSMILNEITFIRCYLDSVIEYADQIVLIDGGSTDGSVEVIQEYINKVDYPEIVLIQYEQKAQPYSKEWKCGDARNRCVDAATGNWIMKLDIDEVMSDNFKELLPGLMSIDKKDVHYKFNFISFWKSLKQIREGDHWSGMIGKLRNNIDTRYQQFHHAGLEYRAKNIIPVPEITMYHLHYGVKAKRFDNRRWEMGMTDAEIAAGKPLKWKNVEGVKWYHGEYPEAVRKYFEGPRDHLKSREAYENFYNKLSTADVGLTKDHLRVSKLKEYFTGDILDLGCRRGEMAKIMAETADSILAIEVSQPLVDVAKVVCKDSDNITIEQGFAEDIEFKNRFDRVTLCELLEHVIDDELIFRKAYEALKPGGFILISVPFEMFFPKSGHVRHYTEKSLEALIEKFTLSYKLLRAGINILAVVEKV